MPLTVGLNALQVLANQGGQVEIDRTGLTLTGNDIQTGSHHRMQILSDRNLALKSIVHCQVRGNGYRFINDEEGPELELEIAIKQVSVEFPQ